MDQTNVYFMIAGWKWELGVCWKYSLCVAEEYSTSTTASCN